MRSKEYPKTDNLFARDPETHKLIFGDYKKLEFSQIMYWHVTEKIDGTNMRILYDPLVPSVTIRGRSDRAQIAGDLMKNMMDMFSVQALQEQFDEFIGPDRIEQGTSVTLYGEGFGPGIQGVGSNYGPEKTFRLFDVMYHWPEGNDSWCQPTTMEQIAEGLSVQTAPIISRAATLGEVWHWVSKSPFSKIAAEHGNPTFVAEGVIARTDPYLYNERGQRVMFKLKGKDIE